MVETAKKFALKTGAVVAVTGKTDIVTDGTKTFLINNGNKMMSSITGTGCQLSALMTAFAAANKDDILTACAAAVSQWDCAAKKAPRE